MERHTSAVLERRERDSTDRDHVGGGLEVEKVLIKKLKKLVKVSLKINLSYLMQNK